MPTFVSEAYILRFNKILAAYYEKVHHLLQKCNKLSLFECWAVYFSNFMNSNNSRLWIHEMSSVR